MSKKGTRALASATLMSLVLTTVLSAGPVQAAAGKVTRTSGLDRYATAASVATANWTTSENVVLVNGENYPDAVSASALAKKLNAPILLTKAGDLNADAKAAISKLGAKKIYVVGGNASVSTAVRDDLKASYSLVELGGLNRYETNVAVAKELVKLGVSAENVLLVGGEGFSDALSVAPVAAAKGQILLLGNNNDDSMKSVIDFVKENNSKVTVVGTKNVISENMLSTLNGTRVDGGSDRFDTNLKVLEAFKSDLKTDKLFVANATGNGFADALVASALAGKSASPLVLVDTDSSEATTNAIKYIKDNATKTTDLNVVGGTGVVSKSVEDSINNAVNPTPSKGDSSVESIEAVSLNQIKVTFNGTVDEDSAEDVTNYKIDGTQLTPVDDDNKAKDENGAVAVLQDDGQTVLITLADQRKQYDEVTVSVKKAILSEDKEETIDAFDQDVEFSDTTVPTLKKVTMEGNSQITVEFSEAINMQTIQSLKSKFKIDGQSIGNYGVNSQYSEIKDSLIVADSSIGKTGTWANKVLFYFDSPIPTGNHTLKVSDGDTDGLLSDVAGFTFKEASEDFSVDSMTTKPVIKSVEETSSGEVHITFDRPMDIQTAKDKSNYEINGIKVSTISGATIKTDDDDTVVKLKHVGSAIESGANTLYIDDSVKDAYGNKVDDDTRISFDDVKDETKPEVQSVTVIDSETIRVRFSKDVDYSYATNTSNYKLQDNKDIDITNHIKAIYSTSGENVTDDTDTYNIKLKKYNPSNSSDDWRLTGSKYTLTIKNIVDTASTPNTMDDYTTTLNGNDDIAPKATGTYAKLRDTSSDKDKVVVYFSEAMDVDTLTNKDNYKFVNGEGDTKSLPGDATISAGGDDKSAIIEFPSSYKVRINTTSTNGTTNDVTKIIVANVKDEAGNILDGVAYTHVIEEAKAGAQVKEQTLKVYYDGDDLKVDVQFDKAIDEIQASDFTLGGVTPTSASVSGDKVTLTFREGAKPSADDIAKAGEITYANDKINTDPTKIDLVKAQGLNAKLAIVSEGTTDETGAKISRDNDGQVSDLNNAQASVYNYEAAPRTTCTDDSDVDYWTATKDVNGGKVYITFDTILDANSGIKSDDFTFTGLNGTDIKADSVKIEGNTVIFSFNKTNKDYTSFTKSVDVRVKSTVSLRTVKDGDSENASYTPSSDDLKKRTVTITGTTPDTTTPAADLTTVAVDTTSVPYTTIVTFKLNVTDPANYTVKVKGVDATFSATNNTFGAAVEGTYTAAQLTAADFVVTKKTTTPTNPTTAAADLTTVAVDTTSVPYTTIVTFKLNVTDPANYTVKVKGVDATFSATNNTFGAAVDGTFTAAQFTAADFVVTAK